MAAKDERPAETLLDLIKQCFLHAAAEEEIRPRLVTRALFRKYCPVFEISEATIHRLGMHFKEARDVFFPPEPNPLLAEDIRDARSRIKERHVKNIISDCSQELDKAPHELGWFQFAHYINLRYGENSAGISRYIISECGGFAAIRDRWFPPNPTPNLIDRRQTQIVARANRKANNYYMDHHYILEQVIEQYADKMFKNAVTPVQHCCKATGIGPKTAYTLVLSDLHIGSDIDGTETGMTSFGRVEEARRMASLVLQTCLFRVENRKNTKLKILILGDAINGILHDPADGDDVAFQVGRCAFIFQQMIRYLLANFPEVEIEIVSGNHDRMKQRHFGRAIQKKYDSFLTMIGIFLQMAFNGVPNLTIKISKTPYIISHVFGRAMYATHGDTCFNVGNPSKTIKTEAIETQIRRLNMRRAQNDKLIAAILGHVHLGTVLQLMPGTTLIVNGGLPPADPFAISLGHLEPACGQQLIEHTADRLIGPVTFLPVGPEDDANEELDRIIRPWEDCF